MTQSRFFQISLFFPFILWCLGLLTFSVVFKHGNSDLLKNLTTGYRVFVPYLIFAALLWKIVDRKTYRSLKLSAFAVPIIWGFFFTVWYIVASLVTGKSAEPVHILCIMAFWATTVAYLLELIPFLILVIFKDDFRSQCQEDRQSARSVSGSPLSPQSH
jgi:hypothetical protein